MLLSSPRISAPPLQSGFPILGIGENQFLITDNSGNLIGETLLVDGVTITGDGITTPLASTEGSTPGLPAVLGADNTTGGQSIVFSGPGAAVVRNTSGYDMMETDVNNNILLTGHSGGVGPVVSSIGFDATGFPRMSNLAGLGTLPLMTDNSGTISAPGFPIVGDNLLRTNSLSASIILNSTGQFVIATNANDDPYLSNFNAASTIGFDSSGAPQLSFLGGSGTGLVQTDNSGNLSFLPSSTFGSAINAPGGISNMVLTGETATENALNISTPFEGNYMIMFWAKVKAIVAGSLVITLKYADEGNVVQTQVLTTNYSLAALTATGSYLFPSVMIYAQIGTNIQITATFTGTSIMYDMGGNATYVQ